MTTAAQTVNFINLIAFLVLAAVGTQRWIQGRRRGAAWVALTFLSLAFVVVVGRYTGSHPHGLFKHGLVRAELLALVLFPYLLYRFTMAFRPAGLRLFRFVSLLTTALVIFTVVLPSLPQAGQAWPISFVVYIVLFLVHWSILAIAFSVRLWRAGQGQPSVARNRMRCLSAASALLVLALLLGVFSSHPNSVLSIVSGALATACALLFLLGLAPPEFIRASWRRPESMRLQEAIRSLMALAQAEEEIAERVLEPTAAIVGARAVAVLNAKGRLVGQHGLLPETVATLESGKPLEDEYLERLEFEGGSILVWTTPYAPFFGDEELNTLKTLGALVGLALDRGRLWAQEHRTLEALRQADELKSNFVALASHELRTPVTAINGFIQTLVGRRETLSADQRRIVEDNLLQQGERMGRLVEQLLDLSRLDAEAIEIHPQTISIAEKLQEILKTAAAGHDEEVEVKIPVGLTAEADPQAFERIVTNLVTNAFRYGAPPIVITAKQTDNHLRIVVEDHGRGVEQAFVPELFERFSRSEGSRAGAKGTGLGLAIARSYAQAHQGDLYYEDAVPHGARFQLVLPRWPKGSRNGVAV